MEKSSQEAQRMICLLCQEAEIVDGLTSVNFERGELRLMVSGVPARVCPNCGEAYLEEDVAIWLLQSAEARREAGVLDARYEYKSVCI
jgi:YgiT-type zinc finger domain-containing protein